MLELQGFQPIEMYNLFCLPTCVRIFQTASKSDQLATRQGLDVSNQNLEIISQTLAAF